MLPHVVVFVADELPVARWGGKDLISGVYEMVSPGGEASENVPLDANVISSHTVYKSKVDYDDVLKMHLELPLIGTKSRSVMTFAATAKSVTQLVSALYYQFRRYASGASLKLMLRLRFSRLDLHKGRSIFVLHWKFHISPGPFGDRRQRHMG